MSREWKETEALRDGNSYSCVDHDTSRVALQIPVAVDGLTVATRIEGNAASCLDIIGGLTLDQLRWMYSSYTAGQLEKSGWDPASLSNSDSNDATHLWSELDSRCPAAEILIAGADDESGTYEYFLETVLTDHENGEKFATQRPNSYHDSPIDEDLVDFVIANDGAISYFGYAYYFANQNKLRAVAIENGAGARVRPNEATVSDGTYEPLARRIYMNLYEDEDSLEATVPLLKFGFSNAGRKLVAATGYVSVSSAVTSANLATIQLAQNRAMKNAGSTGNKSGLSSGAIAGIVIAIVVVLGSVAFLVYWRKKSSGEDTDAVGKDLESQNGHQTDSE